MTRIYLLLGFFAVTGYAASPFIVDNLIDKGLTASQAVVTDAGKQLSSVARGTLSDAGTDGITVTNGASSVFGAGTSFAQHVADATHNGYLSSSDWSTFNGKQNAISIGAFSAAPSAAGLTLSGAAINMDPADATHPGGVSTTTQTIAGAKTFSSAPTFSTMTLGSVLFAGAGGLLTDNNARLFWDNTNFRLGINTATPATAALDVRPSADASAGSVIFTSANGSNSVSMGTSNAGTFRLINQMSGSHTLLAITGSQDVMAWGQGGQNAFFAVQPTGSVPNGYPTMTLEQKASQTGAALDIYDNAGTPVKQASITHAGAASFTNITDTALGAGVCRSSSGGLLSSAELSGDVTTSASNATTVAKIQGTTVSGTTGTTNVVFSTSPTMSNPVVGTQSVGDNSTKAASTAFVQTQLAQLNPAAAVKAASTTNIAGTYTNAVSGVCIGDTFQVTSTAAFAPDGVTLTVGQRFLMKDQSSGFQNGVWTLTTAANVGVLGALLTRALDWDSSADMNAGSLIPVISGTANANTVWYQSAAITTCNSDSQVYTQFSGAASGGAAAVLTKTANYSVLSSDVDSSGKRVMVEANCSADCTITLFAASNTGFEVDVINVGTATATVATAGSDTFGSTADTTWVMPPGGSPQNSNIFKANGGTRWNGF